MADVNRGNRPLSPFMIGQVYRPQITSVLSIMHRITGVGLTLAGVLTVWWFLAASADAESFAFAGVPPGTYEFQVFALNAAGGAYSNRVTLTFPGPCSGAPDRGSGRLPSVSRSRSWWRTSPLLPDGRCHIHCTGVLRSVV